MAISGRDRSVLRSSRFLPSLAAAGLLIWACGDGGAPSTPAPPGATPNPPPAPVAPLLFAWPVGGEEGADWVINNYVDLDPGPGVRDYRGGERVYDGHNGTDIDSPNFRWMDRSFPPVLAAAPGRVTRAGDGEFDRNTVSSDVLWNFVEVTHADGSRAIYGHLKKGSVATSIGEMVSSGQQLGVVGSSGSSTWPHLHFEVRSADNRVLDPFLEEKWLDPPPYDPPLTLMDFNVTPGHLMLSEHFVSLLVDPPPNVDSIAVGEPLGIGMSIAGGVPGDSLLLTLRDGSGSLRDREGLVEGFGRHGWWFWNTQALGDPGIWEIAIQVNDQTLVTYPIRVNPAE